MPIGFSAQRRQDTGRLPTTDEMGRAIAAAALDTSLASGTTIVVGGSLDSLAVKHAAWARRSEDVLEND